MSVFYYIKTHKKTIYQLFKTFFMKTKKLLFSTIFLMVFSTTISFAQMGETETCATPVPYYNITGTGNWPHPTDKAGQEIAVTLETSKSLKLGIDPKPAGSTLIITVNGTETYNGKTGDILIPATAAGQTSEVVVLYTDGCGTFTYTWTIKAPSTCVPTNPVIAAFYTIDGGAKWTDAALATVPGTVEVPAGTTIKFGPNPTAYTWAWTGACSGDLTPSAVVREPSLVASTACSLTATATFDDGCGNLAATKSFVYNIVIGLGVNKFEQGGFNMSVNQADKNLNITFNGDLNVSILNISGQKILSRSISNQASIDISGLSKGVYFMKAFSNGDSIVRKFIKN